MPKVRVTYSKSAQSWDVLPIGVDVVDVLRISDQLTILISATGPCGFVLEDAGDAESQLTNIDHYFETTLVRSALIVAKATDSDVVSTLDHLHSLEARSLVKDPGKAPQLARRGSRSVSVSASSGRIRLLISYQWWLALWGMWISVSRHDGLVLSDIPVRRKFREESVPNVVRVRDDQLVPHIHRGPTTLRRIAIAVLIPLVIAVAFVVIFSRDRSTGAVSESTVATRSTVNTTVNTTAPSTTPQTSTPNQIRKPATDLISSDGSVGIDIALLSTEASYQSGGVVSMNMSYDRVFSNTYGGGTPQQSHDACLAHLGSFQMVPPERAFTEHFVIQLVDSSQEFNIPVPQALVNIGNVIEDCPEVASGSNDQYRIAQRVFYEPLVAEFMIPTEVPAGIYELHIALPGVTWATEKLPMITVTN